jgi:anti-anti-sigma factor
MEPAASSPVEGSSQSRDVLHPLGALDRDASPELREEIGRTLSRGPAELVIDLSGVSGVDGAGLAVLVYACRAATAAHVKLVLFSPSPLVLQLLEPTRLSEHIDFKHRAGPTGPAPHPPLSKSLISPD